MLLQPLCVLALLGLWLYVSDVLANLNCMCTDSCYMIEKSLLVLVFGFGQKLFGGTNGFLVDGVHCKIVRHKMDNGMEEEFLGCKPDISSNLKRLFKGNLHMMLYIFRLKTKKSPRTVSMHSLIRVGFGNTAYKVSCGFLVSGKKGAR